MPDCLLPTRSACLPAIHCFIGELAQTAGLPSQDIDSLQLDAKYELIAVFKMNKRKGVTPIYLPSCVA